MATEFIPNFNLEFNVRIKKEDDWIIKNKLSVEKLTFYDFIQKYHSECLGEINYFNSYYDWKRRKDEIVMVIRRG